MKKVLGYIVLAAMSLLLSSCATLFAGGNPQITIDGQVDEPVTIITEINKYVGVDLPCVVEVNRHKIQGQRISITSDHHQFQDVVLEKTVNEWTFANILFGGIIGWGVDLGTNCVSKPSKTYFFIQERPYQTTNQAGMKPKETTVE